MGRRAAVTLLHDEYGLNGFGVTLLAVTAVVILVAGLVATIIPLERHFGRVACHTFSVQTGRPTKFVIYTFFDGGDCLTPTGKGTWIPVRNLREFGDRP
jgi:hypothetical protein